MISIWIDQKQDTMRGNDEISTINSQSSNLYLIDNPFNFRIQSYYDSFFNKVIYMYLVVFF